MEKYIGQKVIVRATKAGVFYGTLNEKDGDEGELINCRRIWYWDGAASLSQMAVEGVKMPQNCKFTVVVSQMVVVGVCEIIPCTEAAIKNIENVPIWSR